MSLQENALLNYFVEGWNVRGRIERVRFQVAPGQEPMEKAMVLCELHNLLYERIQFVRHPEEMSS